MVHLFLANGGPGGTNLDPLYDEALFWILAVLAVSAALAMILVRHAVHCALMLAVVMLCLAIMYAMQGAPFLAFVQVIVYTGAVLMLFLFVVMLIGTNSSESLVETIRGQRLWAALAAICLAVVLIVGIGHAAIGSAAPETSANSTDNLTGLARLIFTTYVFPFEVTSALLITAALGAMVLAQRERATPCTTPSPCRPCCPTARCRTVRSPTRWSAATCSSAATRRGSSPSTSEPESGSTRSGNSKPAIAAPRRVEHEPGLVRFPGRHPVRDRRGRRARPAQRDPDLPERRADAQLLQPGVRFVLPAARQPGRPGGGLLRDGRRRRRGCRRARHPDGHLPRPQVRVGRRR